jgi:hypothetical protein
VKCHGRRRGAGTVWCTRAARLALHRLHPLRRLHHLLHRGPAARLAGQAAERQLRRLERLLLLIVCFGLISVGLSAERKKRKLSEIQSGVEEAESLVNRCRDAFCFGDPLG